jgi:hypothetical protein
MEFNGTSLFRNLSFLVYEGALVQNVCSVSGAALYIQTKGGEAEPQ